MKKKMSAKLNFFHTLSTWLRLSARAMRCSKISYMSTANFYQDSVLSVWVLYNIPDFTTEIFCWWVKPDLKSVVNISVSCTLWIPTISKPFRQSKIRNFHKWLCPCSQECQGIYFIFCFSAFFHYLQIFCSIEKHT